MVQNKKVGAGLALVVAMAGMGVSGTAAALPEVVVGSHIVQDRSIADEQAQEVDPVQVTSEVNEDTATSDDDAASSVK